jgi:hypothetical protein
LALKDDKDKYLDDKELTDEEINQVLYEIATGQKTEASSKPVDSTDTNPTDNNNQTPTEKTPF